MKILYSLYGYFITIFIIYIEKNPLFLRDLTKLTIYKMLILKIKKDAANY